MATNANARPRNGKYSAAKRAMMEQRDELIARITIRMSEVHIDREPDDQAALASDDALKDLAIVTLERERRTLAEIEAALRRIKEGKYGTCRPCGEQIPMCASKLYLGLACVCAAPSLVPARIA